MVKKYYGDRWLIFPEKDGLIVVFIPSIVSFFWNNSIGATLSSGNACPNVFRCALWKKREKNNLISKNQPNDWCEKCEYTYRSFGFRQRYIAVASAIQPDRLIHCALWKKREKWLRPWNSGDFFFRQPEYTYVLFGRTAFIQKKRCIIQRLVHCRSISVFSRIILWIRFFQTFFENADQNGVSCFMCLMW